MCIDHFQDVGTKFLKVGQFQDGRQEKRSRKCFSVSGRTKVSRYKNWIPNYSLTTRASAQGSVLQIS